MATDKAILEMFYVKLSVLRYTFYRIKLTSYGEIGAKAERRQTRPSPLNDHLIWNTSGTTHHLRNHTSPQEPHITQTSDKKRLIVLDVA